jgi:hypothetical protein
MALSSSGGTITVNGLSEPARARATSVSRDFFSVFGVKPQLGRTFVDDELRFGAPGSLIVSHGFWQKYLDASPKAIGRTLQIGSTLFTIVGVMPAAMDFPAGHELMPHDRAANPSRTSGARRCPAQGRRACHRRGKT